MLFHVSFFMHLKKVKLSRQLHTLKCFGLCVFVRFGPRCDHLSTMSSIKLLFVLTINHFIAHSRMTPSSLVHHYLTVFQLRLSGLCRQVAMASQFTFTHSKESRVEKETMSVRAFEIFLKIEKKEGKWSELNFSKI